MSDISSLPETFLSRARNILGDKGWLAPPSDMRAYLEDWRGRMTGVSPLVARPADVHACAAFVALCQEFGVAITPQGGNTGLVLGGLAQGEVVLSTRRMTSVRKVDPLNDSITVEAGVTLADLQSAAQSAGRLFPLSLASEGQAQIGGLLSTNAGGVNVLRYGMMRDLVLGLEVVLPDGRIWDGLTALRKDNTGYDLKHLFIGAEGTLGVITAATLKLFPQPALDAVAWLAVPDPQAAVELLALARRETGAAISSFELISAFAVDTVIEHFPTIRRPLQQGAADWFVLMEVGLAREEGALDIVQNLFEQAMEQGLVTDGVLAQNDSEAQALWAIRESVPLAERAMGKAIKHDISVPVSSIPAFIEQGRACIESIAPLARLVCFGHVGDGNLHYNVVPPEGLSDAQFIAEYGASITQAVHDLVCQMKGSISAEHGVGLQKRDELAARISPVEHDMMRALKKRLIRTIA